MATHHDQYIVGENKKYFDARAHSYSHSANHQKVTDHVVDALINLEDINWDDETTRLLDYACGPGMISRGLAPYVKEVIGMDISEKMVEEYNQQVYNQGIPRSEMHAILCDICGVDAGEVTSKPEYSNFDIVVCSLALHHFPDPALAIDRLVERLKPQTGVLLIVDFKPHAPMSDKEHHHVAHHGFSEKDIRCWFEKNNLRDVQFEEVGPEGQGGKVMNMSHSEDGKTMKIEREVFLVRGTKS